MNGEHLHQYVKRRSINLIKKIIRIIKKSQYEISGEQFLKFLDTVHISTGENKEDNIGVLLCPWVDPFLPWRNILFALLLKNEGYKNVSLIFNDIWMKYSGFIPYAHYRRQTKSIDKIIKNSKTITDNLNIIYLSTLQTKDISQDLYESIQKLSRIAAVRYFEGSGNYGTIEYKKMVSCFEDIFYYFAPYFESCVTKYNWDKLLTQGGLFMESGLLLECAVENNVSVVTYDSAPSGFFIGNGTPAARCMDIAKAVKLLKSRVNMQEIYSRAIQIMEKRKNRESDVAPHMKSKVIQTAEYGHGDIDNYDIVIFLNVEIDTAALGLHEVFENDYLWITRTIEYLIQNTNYTIAIREHPLQREDGRTNLSDTIREYNKNKRIHYYEYDADINSYDLIERSKVVLVLSSSIGIEAAMCGKRVVLESNCYYSDASFVKHAKNEEEYFQYIINAVNDDEKVSEEDKWEAGLYYYLSQACGSVGTEIHGFSKWVQKEFQDIASDKEMKLILEALMDGEPLSLKLYNQEEGL